MRPPSVLVVFASPHGSTRGIAERIATRLAHSGLEAHVLPADETGEPDGYQAFVIGSAIYNQRWIPSAVEFGRRNRDALARSPVWLFSASAIGDEESFFPAPVARLLRKLRGDPPSVRDLRGVLSPRGHRNFAGALKKGEWPWQGHVFLRALGGRYGDHRNWPAIDAWAGSIAAELAAR